MGITDRSRQYQLDQRRSIDAAKALRQAQSIDTRSLSREDQARLTQLEQAQTAAERNYEHWARQEESDLRSRNYEAAEECQQQRFQAMGELDAINAEIDALLRKVT